MRNKTDRHRFSISVPEVTSYFPFFVTRKIGSTLRNPNILFNFRGRSFRLFVINTNRPSLRRTRSTETPGNTSTREEHVYSLRPLHKSDQTDLSDSCFSFPFPTKLIINSLYTVGRDGSSLDRNPAILIYHLFSIRIKWTISFTRNFFFHKIYNRLV